jgi:hypothetical protein
MPEKKFVSGSPEVEQHEEVGQEEVGVRRPGSSQKGTGESRKRGSVRNHSAGRGPVF